MNARRFLSILVLGALFLAQVPPARAGRMHCPMKTPVRTEACSRCDAPKESESNGSLRATDCCRVTPAHAPEATPLVSATRTSPTQDPLPSVGLGSMSLGVVIAAAGAGACFGTSAPLGSERLSRTTVLRN